MTGYELSRQWFDFAFENPEKINPNHTAMYFFAIEHCNRLGWKEKFGFPSTMAMEAMGVKSYNTYKKTLDDLINWGFFKLIERSRNQYSSNIIALSKNNKALDKALDKALSKHSSKQSESKESINKQTNKEQVNNRTKVLVQGTAFDEKKLIVDILDEVEMEKVPDSKEEQYSLLALHIWNDVNNIRPNNQTTLKAKIGSWYHPIRLMIEQDSRTVKEIWKLWKAIQRDQFWKENVLSTSKLREKFDQLAIKFQPKNNANEIIDALYG